MQGVLRINGRAATIKLRATVKGLPAGAGVEMTDLMFQPDEAVSGWLPHVTELPWSAGMTYLNSGGGGPVYWDDIQGKPVVFPPTSHRHPDATASAAGFMPAADKAELDAATPNLEPDTLVKRSISGQIRVGTPTVDDAAASKAYVDGLVSAEIATGSFVYGEILGNGGNHTRTVTLPAGRFSAPPSISALSGSPRTTPAVDTITTSSFRMRLWNFTASDAPNNDTTWMAIYNP